MNNGKHLESLVAFVEEQMLPDGFDVKTNQRVFNDEGIQIAEFDVEIRGKLGTTEIAWLIECRDRSSSGAAPSSWIEQLCGRRTRFGFNKVTAVSTSGFTVGAQEFAQQQGIELRVVDALTPKAFTWLQLGAISFIEQRAHLEGAHIMVNDTIPEILLNALRSTLANAGNTIPILRSIKTGERCTMTNAFLGFVTNNNLFEGVIPGEPGKKVKLHVRYTNDLDHFVVDTDSGEIRVDGIVFDGELSASEAQVPFAVANTYRNLATGETISQTASLAPRKIAGNTVTLELHRMGENGETFVTLRKTDIIDGEGEK